MAQNGVNQIISELRDRIQHLEGAVARPKAVLPFGVSEIDERLPGGGLAYGALHEFAGGGAGVIDGAAAALFVTGIAARTKEQGRLVPGSPGPVRPGTRPGRPSSRSCDLCRGDQRGVRPGKFRGGASFRRPWGCCRRGGPASHDNITAAPACCRGLRHCRSGDPTMAAADRGRGLRASDSGGNTMANIHPAVRAASGAGYRPGAVAGRTHQGESRRERRFRYRCM